MAPSEKNGRLKHFGSVQLLMSFLVGGVLFLFYMWFYVFVLGADLPKTAILKLQNAIWSTRIDQMSKQLDRYSELLSLMEMRDNRIYRSVYGLDEIPQAVRGSGLGGEHRYAALEGTALLDITRRLDVLEKRAYIQSKSFDDVPSTYRMSSPFGYRSDPLLGYTKRHTGMDFACPPGNPIYATGDGVVVLAKYDHSGYGRHVEIDHGFGYVTRYAHMSRLDVEEGQVVRRGDCIGLSGRSGRITGPHLHYEVIYRNNYVNPAWYMDLDMPSKDYMEMVRKPAK